MLIVNNNQIFIFHSTDFQRYPIGGTIGTIKNFLKYTEYECMLVGLTNDSRIKVGEWQKIRVRGKIFEFLPVAYSKKEKIPHKVIMLLGTIRFRNKIFAKCRHDTINAMFYVDRQCHTVLKHVKPRHFKLHSFYKMTDAVNPLKTSGRKISKIKLLQDLYFLYFFKPLLVDASAIFGINDDCRAFCNQTLTSETQRRKYHHLNHFLDYDKLLTYIPEKPEKGTSGTKHLIFWGRIVEVKGLHLMIDSTKRLNADGPRCHLTIIGDGEDRAKIEQYAQNTGCNHSIRFAGRRNIEEIAELSANADLFLMSSFSEGIPTAMLEAMVFGLPAVSTAVGGIPTLIKQGVNGYLVYNRNPDDYQSAIEKALKLDRKKVLHYNQNLIKNEFSARAIVGEMDRLIKKAIA